MGRQIEKMATNGNAQNQACTNTFGCSDVQNNQVEMGTTTPKDICDRQKDHCKGDEACPNFNKPFQVHADASHCQLGAAVSQEGKPMAFHGRKLNPAQARCTIAEREPLTTAETLKERGNTLLGQQIEVFTDHKSPVCKRFNVERVVRWRLLLEEFGPELTQRTLCRRIHK